MLARRLLHQQSQSLEAEAAMITRLTVSLICVSEDAESIFNSLKFLKLLININIWKIVLKVLLS